ncbi:MULTISPECIES: hypothetical protein [Bacteroides]|jgi:hypothetical protein|uniref:hypothetical protein n=1 Tax=Bacteroides TaxID=816 RepID=UPI001C01E3FC|nr:hypothetical protein [Bacteroides ovatus]MBS5203405.1 hypothetical protein [Bacteroides ovatus]MBT9935111.1 hypothetical protein [Bacteroides ovatus]
MEHIRSYCEYIDMYFQINENQEKQNKYHKEQNKCLDAISNKLLLMDKNNKEYYAKMIAYYLEHSASIDFDLDTAFRKNDGLFPYDDATLCVVELVLHIYRLFFMCNVDMNNYLKRFTIPNLISEKENSDNSIIFDEILISKVYNKCNGKQWENISKDDFINIIKSNGENNSLKIKDKEINRTKCIFKAIACRIEDREKRKLWIEGIKKHIFNDVDFMKATLQTNRYGAGYSELDVNFKPFLDNL